MSVFCIWFLIVLIPFCHTLLGLIIDCSMPGYIVDRVWRGIGFGGTHWHTLVWYIVHNYFGLVSSDSHPRRPLKSLIEDYASLVTLRLHMRLTRPILTSGACSCALTRSLVHYRSSSAGNTLLELGPRTKMLFTYTSLFCAISLHVSTTI